MADDQVSEAQPAESLASTLPATQNASVASKIPKVFQKAPEEQGKQTWQNPLEFLMSCLSFAVGLGNIWRFPFKAAQNGGGSFLIPYLIILTLIGRPLFYLELMLGQFNSVGPVKCWNMCPFFKGVGAGTSIISLVISTYYTVIMSWTFSFLFYSFRSPLPWANRTGEFFRDEILHTLPKEDFAAGAGFGGHPSIPGALALFSCWCIVLLAMGRGIAGVGKIAYFTAILPYIMLVILLARACFLKNSAAGILYFLKPNFSKVFSMRTWLEATGQVFFSLGTAMGQCTSFAAINDFKHNIKRDVLVIAILDTTISLMAGIVVFAVLGNLSYHTNTDLKVLASRDGSTLAFVAFPAVLERMGNYPSPQIFAVLFFAMLLTLALGSANGMVAVFISVVVDMAPFLKNWTISLTCTFFGFLFGLAYITPGGQYILEVVDTFVASSLLLFFALVEVIAVSFVYGLKNFAIDLEFMFETTVSIYWLSCWGAIMPILLSIVTISSFYSIKMEDYWPPGARAFGIIMAVMVAMMLPIFAFVAVRKGKGDTWKTRFLDSILPNQDHGPMDPERKKQWLAFKQERLKTFSFRQVYKDQLLCCFGKNKVVAEQAPSSTIYPDDETPGQTTDQNETNQE